jgi:hypothetical protein
LLCVHHIPRTKRFAIHNVPLRAESGRKNTELAVIKTYLSHGFGTHDNRTPHADAGSGGGRSSAISRRISGNRVLGMATFGHLEGDITAVADDLRADLDEFFLQARQ